MHYIQHTKFFKFNPYVTVLIKYFILSILLFAHEVCILHFSTISIKMLNFH